MIAVFTLALGIPGPASMGFAASSRIDSSSEKPASTVVVAHHPYATDAFKPNPEVVRSLLHSGIKRLAGKTTTGEAWKTIVSPTDVVGIKVHSLPGKLSGTRLPVVEAAVEGLLEAGVPSKNIIVWDKTASDLRNAGYFELRDRFGIRVMSSTTAGYDYLAYYESSILGNLVWGDFDFGRSVEGLGRKSYVTKLLTQEITRVIVISPLLNHNTSGVSGNLYSLAMGAVDNTVRFENDPVRMAQAVPEIFALEWLSDKLALCITDALVCQYEGGERSLLHYSVTPNELWISKDPVALDTLALQEVSKQREMNVGSPTRPNTTLYSNAALLELGNDDTNRINVIKVRLP